MLEKYSKVSILHGRSRKNKICSVNSRTAADKNQAALLSLHKIFAVATS